MSAFEFKPAVREQVGLVIGLAGASGSGKTFTAMSLASGLAGGKRFAVIDTESGRARHYADMFAFDTADLGAPFRPGRYAEAIEAADKAGYPVIVVDSMSHEHAGDGGLLDWHEEELDRMAGDDWRKRESCKMSAWIKPKMEHKRFVSHLLRTKAHVILCFRAEQKTDIVKVEDRMQIVPKKLASGFSDWIPIAEKNVLYELTTSFLLTPDRPGVGLPIKLQEQHRAFFPEGRPINSECGRLLGSWAAGGASRREAQESGPTPAETPASAPADDPLRGQDKNGRPYVFTEKALPRGWFDRVKADRAAAVAEIGGDGYCAGKHPTLNKWVICRYVDPDEPEDPGFDPNEDVPDELPQYGFGG